MKRREQDFPPGIPVRIGSNTSIAGRLERAAERAHELGGDALTISSDRTLSGERLVAARL